MSDRNQEIRFSIFRNAKDTVPSAQQMPWAEFVASIGPHELTYKEKTSCPMFSPAEFRVGAPNRKKENVVGIWFGVLDFDGITAEQLLRVCRKLEGRDAVLYTTWGHSAVAAKGLWKVRVCIRFTRSVDPGEWPVVWQGMNGYFDSLSDPQCKDAGHCYFSPCAPPGTPAESCEIIHFRGEPVDPSVFCTKICEVASGTEQIPRERLEMIAKRWRNSKVAYRAKMSEILTCVVRGEPFAAPGERDTTLFQLCQDLAREMPEADAGSVSELFASSLQLMGSDAPTVEQVWDKFERARVSAIIESERAQVSIIEEGQLRIQQCFAHLDPTRDYPYSSPEIDSMRQKLKCTSGEMSKRWIILAGAQYFFLGPGAIYSDPYSKDEALGAALRELAPASTAGVELWTETKKGRAQKTLSTLIAAYGTVAKGYVLDLAAQEASYNPATRMFTVAPCPLRKLEPTYDPEVAEWLRLLAGPAHEDVLNWLAHVTDLTIPCAALVMTGPPDTGKSLFAYGISRLWTTNGPTKASSAFGDFNAAITSCPVVFADEKLPTDFRGNGRTSELREFIADRMRPFRQKHIKEGSILGAIRFLGAANNDNFMAVPEHLGTDDIHAISSRFFHVRVQEQAANYLRTVDVERFVKDDAIAKHVLWLRDNYPKKREGRFVLKAKDPEFFSGLSTRSGFRSSFMQWCIGYLKAPGRIDSRVNYHVRIKNGGLWVRSEQVLETWDTYVPNVPVPPTRALAQVIIEMSNSRDRLLTPKGERPNYYRVDPTHLYVWAEATDFLTREEIDAALAKDTEERMSGTTKVL